MKKAVSKETAFLYYLGSFGVVRKTEYIIYGNIIEKGKLYQNICWNIPFTQEAYAIVDSKAFYIDYTTQKASILSGNYWAYAYDLSVKYLGDGYYATYSRANFYKTYTAIYKNGKRILKFASIEGLGESSVKDVSLISEGNWAIKPQYTSATDFCGMRNVAVVNNGKTIINSDGEIIFTVETAEE